MLTIGSGDFAKESDWLSRTEGTLKFLRQPPPKRRVDRLLSPHHMLPINAVLCSGPACSQALFIIK